MPSALLFVKHVEDSAGQEGVARLCPVIDKAFSFGVDEDGHKILDIADLVEVPSRISSSGLKLTLP